MKVVAVVGARPQFIKAVSVSRVLREAGHEEFLLHTGQHYDRGMSQVFFEELGLREPDANLGVGSGPHGWQTAEILKHTEIVLEAQRPQCVLVYGDTNSTVAGALAAVKLGLAVPHVEAGLRSFNRRMPEEINRVVTDHISRWLFCPTQTAVKNLMAEGIAHGVHLVGDVMHDVLQEHVRVAERTSTVLERLALRPRGYLLATVHRAENTDEPERLRSIAAALIELVNSGCRIVLPLHPRTRKLLDAQAIDLAGRPALLAIDAVPYLDMLVLEKHARVILTDSGGVQKEADWFDVPCVTLRDETEWVETVESGRNVLVGATRPAIVRAALDARPLQPRATALDDGGASRRIVERIAADLSAWRIG